MEEKRYDLEERTLRFAHSVGNYVRTLPSDVVNREVGRQLVRSSGSVGANYREAEEALGKKDFAMRIKISRKEAKESLYWLQLSTPTTEQENQKRVLIQEALELTKIFGAIITNYRKSQL